MTKIVICDDNSDILFSVRKGLESLEEDYEIFPAHGGRECVRIVEEHHPDIIVLDIMMPDMDGWDVVAKLRDNNDLKDIPIIFLTAKDDALSKGMASLGVDDYVVKPVEIHELNNRIKKALQ